MVFFAGGIVSCRALIGQEKMHYAFSCLMDAGLHSRGIEDYIRYKTLDSPQVDQLCIMHYR
jgi:hypothetical protein